MRIAHTVCGRIPYFAAAAAYEVDAPLDDANIGRFAKMLEGMKDQTQFVLITHSRKTMEIADQLYGVTMEEPGVSKLVSVRFQ